MKPNISEFSYGYALTDELVHWHSLPITAAPVFPSLYDEGKPGGGYDVKLEKPGIPLFLQFKLSHCMVRNTAMEVTKKCISSKPFYRMYIRPHKHSAQHEMLLDLEASGNEVYYSAPYFHKLHELNDAYISHSVKRRSLWLKPSSIGNSPNDEHHVSFKHPAELYICSEPRKIEASGSFEEFSQHIMSIFEERAAIAMKRESLNATADLLRTLSGQRTDFSDSDRETSVTGLSNRHPLQQMAFYSHVYFDAQLFVITKSEPSEPNG
jgi:hypothetical protein